MIKTPTTLILGAGASAHLNFPTGEALYNRIVEAALTPVGNLHDVGFKPDDLKRFGNALKGSGAVSVDEFLQTRREFLQIGKVAIAQELIGFENEALLHTGGSENWYFYLLKKLCESAESIEDLEENNLTIITFNYDRSLEQFLFVSLLNRFDKKVPPTGVIAKLGIHHIHGHLGRLHWQVGNEFARPYDAQQGVPLLRAVAEEMRIIHEEVTVRDVVQHVLANSQRVYFLGLGYHELNMKRLGFPLAQRPNQVLGTSFGLTFHEAAILQDKYNVRLLFNEKAQRGKVLDLLRNEAYLT